MLRDSFQLILYHTFIKLMVCLVSVYLVFVSYYYNKKAWSWIFGVVTIFYYTMANKNMHLTASAIPDYFYIATAFIILISIFSIGDDSEVRVTLRINKKFYPFVIMLIILIFLMAGNNYRWERVDELIFNIDDHIVIIENFPNCGDLRACGWKYYKDRFTGSAKAIHYDFEPPEVIYEDELLMPKIEFVIDIGLFIIKILTLISLYYYVKLNVDNTGFKL